jgi:hypothetical protein
MSYLITPHGHNYGAYRIGKVLEKIEKGHQKKSFDNGKKPASHQKIESQQEQPPCQYSSDLEFIEQNKPKNTQTQDEHHYLVCIYHKVKALRKILANRQVKCCL